MGSISQRTIRPLVPGIYCPTQCFFLPGSEDLDLNTISRHARRLAECGVAGIACNGSNGEAVYLSPEERKAVVTSTRRALDDIGYLSMPIIVGASEQSVRGTVQLCRDAADAGGDVALIMVPSFFKWAMDTVSIEQYFTLVADRSPIPVLIYNYPAAVAGIDLDSDMLVQLARHPNIIGTKFTCGNTGKLARVADATSSSGEYFCLSGVTDQIAPSLAVGAVGAIVGAANVFPRACVELYKLCVSDDRSAAAAAAQGDQDRIRQLQAQLAHADWAMTKRAIPGFKALLEKVHGYGAAPRLPMRFLGQKEAQDLYEEVQKVMEYELSLAAQASD